MMLLPKNLTKVPGKQSQRGLSMIELMIAITIGLLLTLAVTQSFVSMVRSYEFNQEYARIQQNGRFAMEFMTRDIRGAGFWGCNGLGLAEIHNHVDDPSDEFNFDGDIKGTDGGDGAPTSAYDPPDTIILRGAYGDDVNVEQVPATTSASLKVTENSNLLEGEIVLVTDCTQGDIFKITNDPTTGAAGFDNVVHNAAASEDPQNDGVPLQKIYGTDAEVFKVSSFSYDIQVGASGQNALFRNDVELVDGIENMQVLYGADTLGNDGVPDFFAKASNPALNFEEVVSVDISFVAVSLVGNMANAVPDLRYNGGDFENADGRLRRVFSTRIALRNRLN